MGGKSKSSSNTKTTTTQNINTETNQADASGVITGDVLQGEITYYNEFSPEVADAFSQLIELSSDAGNLIGSAFQDLIDLANKGLDVSKATGETALNKVSERFETAEQPNVALAKAFIPILMLGVAGITVYFIFKRR